MGGCAGLLPALCPLMIANCASRSRVTLSTGSPGQGWGVGRLQLHPSRLRKSLPSWPPLPVGPQVLAGPTVPAETPWMEEADPGEEALHSLSPSISSPRSTTIIPSSPNHTQLNGPQGPVIPHTLLPQECDASAQLPTSRRVGHQCESHILGREALAGQRKEARETASPEALGYGSSRDEIEGSSRC